MDEGGDDIDDDMKVRRTASRDWVGVGVIRPWSADDHKGPLTEIPIAAL